jgi:hypothetical protein
MPLGHPLCASNQGHDNTPIFSIAASGKRVCGIGATGTKAMYRKEGGVQTTGLAVESGDGFVARTNLAPFTRGQEEVQTGVMAYRTVFLWINGAWST